MQFLESPNFSGHETFPFRYGWLKKGIDAINEDSGFFNRDDAMITLGVGKNMVLSIKHWCTTANLIYRDAVSKDWHLTKIGKKIFSPEGHDPYLEDPCTLWLLHWLISSNYFRATAWFYTFSYWNQPDFTKESLTKTLIQKVKEQGFKNVSENTIKRDIDCFVRTYVPSRISKGTFLEDTFDCPLADLELIMATGDKSYYLHRGNHPSLSNELFTYMLLDFWARYLSERKSITFEEISYKPGSPGRLLRMDENSIALRLEYIEKQTNGALIYGETAGLKQIYKNKDINLDEFIDECYSSIYTRSENYESK